MHGFMNVKFVRNRLLHVSTGTVTCRLGTLQTDQTDPQVVVVEMYNL